MGAVIDLATDRQFQISFLVSVALIATVYTLLEPFLIKDKLKERMQSVADYRNRLREQNREALGKRQTSNLRTQSAKGPLKEVVENLKLFEVFDAEEARKKLTMAGYRGSRPLFVFMAARIGMPFALAAFAGFYTYVVNEAEQDNFTQLLTVVGAFFLGFYVPNIHINGLIKQRQQKIKLAWPDALDLLLICVESGMSIEAAMQKVSEEVGPNCPELGEELGLTVAELSYLQERRQAYVNLAARTGLEGVKGVTTALLQSEKYGTPLGQSLRVMANENRVERMQEAEKKAAALPPKLTVPMIGFFLPVLFAVIMGPAVMGIMNLE